MSILAGFDLVIELNRNIIVDRIRQTSINGYVLDPPTELVLGDTHDGADAIILDPITVSLVVGSNGMVITIPFDETTFYHKGTVIGPTKGNLVINGTIDEISVDPSTNLNDIGLIVPISGVSLNWDTSSSYTQQSLANLSSSDRSDLETNVKLAVWQAFTANAPSAKLNFNTDPSRNGLLGKGGLRFRTVTVQNIDADTIGIFCMMLVANEEPASVIRIEAGLPGRLGVAVSMSEATFQQLVFCPSATQGLVSKFDPSSQTPDQYAEVVSSKMTPVCGGADYVPLPDALKLVYLQASFQDGSVLVTGTAIRGKTGTYCFRLNADFNSNLILNVKNGVVQAKLEPNPPNINATIDVSWYCFLLYFVAAMVLSPVSAVLAIWILFTAEWLTYILAPMFVHDPINIGQPQQIGLNDFVLVNIIVFADRLTLFGRVPSPLPSDRPDRSVTLTIAEQPGSQTEVGSGIYPFPGSKHCKAKNYSYKEFTDEDTVTISATPSLMGVAPEFFWTVEGNQLTSSSGDLPVQVGATIPQPGGLTLNLGIQPTTVSYVLNNPTLILTGHDAFNYSVKVRVQCKSQSGFTASDEILVTFTNHTIQMGDKFEQDMAQCALAAKVDMSKLRTLPQGVPRSGDPPDYGEIVEILRQAALERKPGAIQAIADSVQLFGPKVVDDILALPERPQGQVLQYDIPAARANDR